MLTFEVLSDDGELSGANHKLVDGCEVAGDVVEVYEVGGSRVEDVVKVGRHVLVQLPTEQPGSVVNIVLDLLQSHHDGLDIFILITC